MNTMLKLGRVVLALVLVLSMMLGSTMGGFRVIATENADPVSHSDAILDQFFNEDMTTEESFDKIRVEADQMTGYESLQYQYVPNEDSYYIALGDATIDITKRQTSTYVDKLADMLGVPYLNLGDRKDQDKQLFIQDIYPIITNNSKEIAKADLITIGWSNYGATFYMCQYMSKKADRVTQEQWSDLVGEENLPRVEELLDEMFQKLRDNDVSQFDGYDLEGGLECYAYTYLSNVIHQAQVIESIRVFNQDAVIVLVGTYNDLEGIVLNANGEEMDLGDMMGDLVNISNLLTTKNAESYGRVAYVHAPDVETTLDANAKKYSTPQQYVLAIIGRQGLPNDSGHKYIAKQIKAAFSETCGHFWDDGVITTEPTCENDGVMTFTCTWCGEQKTEVIAGGHEYRTEEKEVTCTEDGYIAHICDKCGDQYKTDEVKAPGHAWDAGVVTKEPTETENGEKVYTCATCGETKTETLPKTGADDFVPGDVNGDGRITARDVRAMMLYIAGLAEEGTVNEAAADYNNDGRVTARDVRAIMLEIAGLA